MTASLTHSGFLRADKDYKKAAAAVDLFYVTDETPGIARLPSGKEFKYLGAKKTVASEKQLARIRKLAIPPAWTSVWICPLENGHIQATGIDIRGRKQYRYHSLWNTIRTETKFHRLYEFGKTLPRLRARMEADMRKTELNQVKVVATVIALMERTYIRIGNSSYEKLYGSFGLTTLKDRHVSIQGDKMSFSFRGKKGIHHEISLKNRRLARSVKACRDIPGKELFQYFDPSGGRHSVESGMVNNYIRDATGMECSAKDFRTWAGSVHALDAFISLTEALSDSERKRNINQVLDIVSKKLGNSRTICRKYYVHPALIRLYEEDSLKKYNRALDKLEVTEGGEGLTPLELVLLKILKDAHSAVAA